MDFVLVLLMVTVVGIVKIIKAGGFSEYTPPVLQKDGSVVYQQHTDIPIGNNLSLLREPDAFTKILKQLRLKA